MGTGVPRVHDEEHAVRFQTFLVGQIIVELIRIVEAGRIHDDHAAAQHVQRKSDVHPGHQSGKTAFHADVVREIVPAGDP